MCITYSGDPPFPPSSLSLIIEQRQLLSSCPRGRAARGSPPAPRQIGSQTGQWVTPRRQCPSAETPPRALLPRQRRPPISRLPSSWDRREIVLAVVTSRVSAPSHAAVTTLLQFGASKTFRTRDQISCRASGCVPLGRTNGAQTKK